MKAFLTASALLLAAMTAGPGLAQSDSAMTSHEAMSSGAMTAHDAMTAHYAMSSSAMPAHETMSKPMAAHHKAMKKRHARTMAYHDAMSATPH